MTLCRAFLHQPERPQRHRTAALYSTCAAKAEILHSLALPSPAASDEQVGMDVLWASAHVILLETTDSLADGRFDLSLGSWG